MVENASNRHKGFISGVAGALMPGRRRLEAALSASERERETLSARVAGLDDELRALREEREALLAQMRAVGSELQERQAQAGSHDKERNALLHGIATLLEEAAARGR